VDPAFSLDLARHVETTELEPFQDCGASEVLVTDAQNACGARMSSEPRLVLFDEMTDPWFIQLLRTERR
jgi:Txe/YoeB family toxin of Txe-Axe toxin-antitoxin module